LVADVDVVLELDVGLMVVLLDAFGLVACVREIWREGADGNTTSKLRIRAESPVAISSR
jgi:hypothetical protein